MIRVIFGTHLKLEKHTTRKSRNTSSAGELPNPVSKGGQGRGVEAPIIGGRRGMESGRGKVGVRSSRRVGNWRNMGKYETMVNVSQSKKG